MPSAMRLLPLLGVFFLIPSPSQAEGIWTLLEAIKSENSYSLYVDVNSFHRSGQVVSVRVLESFDLPQRSGRKYYRYTWQSRIFDQEYDCAAKEFRRVAMEDYSLAMGKKLLWKKEIKHKWMSVDQVNRSSVKLYQIVCR